MSILLRILSFVPPTLLFIIPVYSQIQGSIEQVPGSNNYQISVIPTVNWSPPESTTSSGQLTFRALTGTVEIGNFQSQTGTWVQASMITSPAEAPEYDYFSFSLNSPISNIDYVDGTAVPLFSFENNEGCAVIELIDNDTDPFMPPNSMNVNIGNSFSIFGAGVGQNAYEGHSTASATVCNVLGVSATALNNPVLCNGDLTTINLQVTGGVEPYSVEWTNLSTSSTGFTQIMDYEGSTSFSNMEAGDYLFTITDDLDSLHEYTFKLFQPAPISLQMGAFDANCDGSMDGVAYVDDASGGTISSTGDYQYYWNTNPGVSSQSIGFLNPGTYFVTVVDDNGCQEEGSVEVESNSILIINAQTRDISCNGYSDGVIDVYPIGQNPPFTFEWTPNVTTGQVSSAWMLGEGSYTVTVTDYTGVCSATRTFDIAEPPAMESDYRLSEPRCHGDLAYLHLLEVANAFEPYTIDIIGGYTEIAENEYEVEPGVPLRLVIEDDHGCLLSEDFLIPAKQEMVVDLGANHTIKYGEWVAFNSQIFPLDNVELSWTPAESLSCPDCPDPVATPTENTTYVLTMTDTSGCQVEDEVSVFVHKSREIYIPTAFSPNQDGINDVFYPLGGFEVVKIHSMAVFDRWGGLMYQSQKKFGPNEPDAGWDGKIRGRFADTGIYLYTMSVEFVDGETVLFSGEVNLMR